MVQDDEQPRPTGCVLEHVLIRMQHAIFHDFFKVIVSDRNPSISEAKAEHKRKLNSSR